MSASRDRQIVIELVVRSGHPALLAGLDAWLQLGLISDPFVRQLCQAELTCPLPERVAIPTTTASEQAAELAPPRGDRESMPVPPQRVPQPTVVAQALQAFMAEISVVWLLFLGVFLVVVSSGVLAATQWRNVAPVGQYGILFAYTLVFGVASLWTRQRSVLQLTSRMVTIATLLLIPVNFWMMDGFGLWHQVAGMGMTAIAVVSLTVLTVVLLRHSTPRWLLTIVIGLSWLHWGWRLPGMPLIAPYLGTLGAMAVSLYQDVQVQPSPPDAFALETTPSTIPLRRSLAAVSTIAIALSALLLLGRAIFVALVPIGQLGLALGGLGWLLGWLGRRDRDRAGWSRAGAVLLLGAWLVTVGATPPWQAIAISGLSLSLLINALWQTERSSYLMGALGVGLQLVWLAWRLLPSPWQTQIVDQFTVWAGTQAMPFALLGFAFFPYVMLMAGAAMSLRQRDRPSLARDTEGLALSLGTLLLAISVGNPLVRSLTLTLASLTLIGVTIHRQPRLPGLIHLTHGVMLSTVIAWIYSQFPALATQHWVGILLLLMALEWSYSTMNNSDREIGAKSAWYFGLGLAAMSYVLMWDMPWNLPALWRLSWFWSPVLLTGLAYRDRVSHHWLAGWLSVLGLVIVQPLTITPGNVRLASLGIATLLMILNTHQLQALLAAVLTVGFGLGFWSLSLWEIGGEWLTFGWVTVWIALTVLFLWGLRLGFERRRSHLAQHYRRASDGWAIAVLLLAFLLISSHQLLVWLQLATVTGPVILAAGILVIATTFRLWQSPSEAGWLALASSIELLTVSSLLLVGRSLPNLAIANIVLGFLAQIAGDRAVAGSRPASTPRAYPLSWQLIPLAYGLIALWLSHQVFTATTGLYTLAVAVLAGQIGRRSLTRPILSMLAVVGISAGAFELLIYQLAQAPGGNPGDGIVGLAGLAIALTWTYYGWQAPLTRYLQIPASAWESLIQVHWGIGTLFLIAAVPASLSRAGQLGWTATATLLAGYALTLSNTRWQAWRSTATTQSLPVWTQAGIWELFAAIASLLWWQLPPRTLLDWAGAIAAGLAVCFYHAPWQQWGWQQRPWQTAATLLPGGVILLTGWAVNIPSLLLTAAFYLWLASIHRTIRLSYVGLLLADWALIRWLFQLNFTQPLWFAAIAGGSILYLAQAEPALQNQERQEQRHWVRSCATALICLASFYQAEAGMPGLSPFAAGLVAIAIAFSFILLGLVQRVRAFLYVGTLTFLLQILWQLWRFIRDYSLLLWIIGIIVGLILIWVAATFEARRTQANALLQHWVTELADWQ